MGLCFSSFPSAHFETALWLTPCYLLDHICLALRGALTLMGYRFVGDTYRI